jgi:hypothetical protein
MKLMYSGSLLHILSYGYVVQPTPHQSLPSRRSSLLPADGEVEGMSKFGCRTVLPSLSNSWGSVSWDFLVSVSVAFDQHNSLCVS